MIPEGGDRGHTLTHYLRKTLNITPGYPFTCTCIACRLLVTYPHGQPWKGLFNTAVPDQYNGNFDPYGPARVDAGKGHRLAKIVFISR